MSVAGAGFRLSICARPTRTASWWDEVPVERNLGEWLHSVVQSNALFSLPSRYPNVLVIPELRVGTSVGNATGFPI